MQRQKGFSLIELLIYIGIFAASSVFLVSILIIFTRIHVRQTSINEVNGQLSFINNTIQRLVRDSSLIDMEAGTATSTITLRMASSTLDPTSVYLDKDESIIYLSEGGNNPLPLTDTNIVVDDFSVTKYENPGGHAIVQVYVAVRYNTENPKAKFRRTLYTAISRVSAATFDSDVLPNTGNSYDMGNSTSTWRDAYFSGNIGIGVSPTASARIKSAGNIGFTSSTEGIIFVTPSGSCLKMTLTNSGNVSTSSVACP